MSRSGSAIRPSGHGRLSPQAHRRPWSELAACPATELPAAPQLASLLSVEFRPQLGRTRLADSHTVTPRRMIPWDPAAAPPQPPPGSEGGSRLIQARQSPADRVRPSRWRGWRMAVAQEKPEASDRHPRRGCRASLPGCRHPGWTVHPPRKAAPAGSTGRLPAVRRPSTQVRAYHPPAARK